MATYDSGGQVNTLGSRIRATRKAKGLTLERLAIEAGLAKGFLSAVENDKRGISVAKCQRIADKLEVSLDFLSGGRDVSYECPFCKGTGVI